jgi:hypothetical protein
VPRITLYIRRLFLPFFVKMTRDEAYALFHELNPEVAQAMVTTGVVNILPEAVARKIMPKQRPTPLLPQPDPVEDLKMIRIEDQGIRMTKPKAQLLGSGSRKTVTKHSTINQGIKDITQHIPTLEPVFGKILGNQFRQLMSKFSHRALAVSSIFAGCGIVLQAVLSKHARRWIAKGVMFSVLGGSFVLLAGSLLGLIVKFLHMRIEEPVKSMEEVPKIFKGIRQIKTRFNSKADKNNFFNPDLKMAS